MDGVKKAFSLIDSNIGAVSASIATGLSLVSAPATETDLAPLYNQIENTNVTQYNEFHNEFNGDVAGQRDSHKAMERNQRSSLDELSRVLTYVR